MILLIFTIVFIETHYELIKYFLSIICICRCVCVVAGERQTETETERKTEREKEKEILRKNLNKFDFRNNVHKTRFRSFSFQYSVN